MNQTARVLSLLCVCAFGFAMAAISSTTAQAADSAAPKYEVDPSWPKPFPNQWVFGGLGGLCIDAQDHVFLLHRQDPSEEDLNSGRLAPLIIELDPAGAVVNSWGDPNVLEARLHSCFVDRGGDIWVASSPSGMVQKFSHDGSKLLLQVGKKGVLDSADGTAKGKPLNSSAARFFMPSSLYADPQNGEVFVADGEGAGGNRRIAVLDRNGAFLRQWLPEMETVHCMSVAKDGLVYVCNRLADRVQVYDKNGKSIRSIDIPWAPVTTRSDGKVKASGGAAVALAFSSDANQRLMFVINQNNTRVEVIERATGKILSSFGSLGHYPGQFDQPHGIAVDSKGNVYVAENRGKRVQKFRVVGQ
jgi:DNA-binding beta-propeller fold protein YncE